MIGIAITTTTDRKDCFKNTFEKWSQHTPKDIYIYVHTDTESKGVAYSKNKCLEALYNKGCDNIFLADDDCFPLVYDWWKPYVESKHNHLMYQFKLPHKKPTDMQEVYRDDKIVAYTHTRGALLYYKRKVLDVVGGFDTAYGRYGFEHADLTNRIHNAGLTKYRAMDVVDSDKLFYCLDQDTKIVSNLSDEERKECIRRNSRLYRLNRQSKKYKEFRSE